MHAGSRLPASYVAVEIKELKSTAVIVEAIRISQVMRELYMLDSLLKNSKQIRIHTCYESLNVRCEIPMQKMTIVLAKTSNSDSKMTAGQGISALGLDISYRDSTFSFGLAPVLYHFRAKGHNFELGTKVIIYRIQVSDK